MNNTTIIARFGVSFFICLYFTSIVYPSQKPDISGLVDELHAHGPTGRLSKRVKTSSEGGQAAFVEHVLSKYIETKSIEKVPWMLNLLLEAGVSLDKYRAQISPVLAQWGPPVSWRVRLIGNFWPREKGESSRALGDADRSWDAAVAKPSTNAAESYPAYPLDLQLSWAQQPMDTFGACSSRQSEKVYPLLSWQEQVVNALNVHNINVVLDLLKEKYEQADQTSSDEKVFIGEVLPALLSSSDLNDLHVAYSDLVIALEEIEDDKTRAIQCLLQGACKENLEAEENIALCLIINQYLSGNSSPKAVDLKRAKRKKIPSWQQRVIHAIDTGNIVGATELLRKKSERVFQISPREKNFIISLLPAILDTNFPKNLRFAHSDLVRALDEYEPDDDEDMQDVRKKDELVDEDEKTEDLDSVQQVFLTTIVGRERQKRETLDNRGRTQELVNSESCGAQLTKETFKKHAEFDEVEKVEDPEGSQIDSLKKEVELATAAERERQEREALDNQERTQELGIGYDDDEDADFEMEWGGEELLSDKEPPPLEDCLPSMMDEVD